MSYNTLSYMINAEGSNPVPVRIAFLEPQRKSSEGPRKKVFDSFKINVVVSLDKACVDGPEKVYVARRIGTRLLL